MSVYQSANNILERVKDEEILEKLKNVDGDGSGLDADLVRGYDMLTRNYVSPVDLSSATSDYNLQVGEVAKIDFSSATSVPLHIATQSGTAYEMFIYPDHSVTTTISSGSIHLNPNNTVYSSAFKGAVITRDQAGFSSGSGTGNNFTLGFLIGLSYVLIQNRTISKNIVCIKNYYGSSNSPAIVVYASQWHDITTTWISLGTITFPDSISGTILVRRLM